MIEICQSFCCDSPTKVILRPLKSLNLLYITWKHELYPVTVTKSSFGNSPWIQASWNHEMCYQIVEILDEKLQKF